MNNIPISIVSLNIRIISLINLADLSEKRCYEYVLCVESILEHLEYIIL